MFDIQEELGKLPKSPGVYLMHDQKDRIIYIGKAVNLKNRVRQYFQSSRGKSDTIAQMVTHIARFEYIVTDSELEALVLENNLIKEHRPRYNTMLKDDKTYPYIKVTVAEDFPRLLFSRIIKKDKSKYFGPYSSSGAVNDTLELLRKLFKIRTCNRALPRDIGKERPCLNYHIKQCDAPCQGYVSKEGYAASVQSALDFLGGRYAPVLKGLEQKMKAASDAMDFEKAIEYRELLGSVRQVAQKQKITDVSDEDRDIVAVAMDETDAVVQVFFVRGGKLIGREHFHMRVGEDAALPDGQAGLTPDAGGAAGTDAVPDAAPTGAGGSLADAGGSLTDAGGSLTDAVQEGDAGADAVPADGDDVPAGLTPDTVGAATSHILGAFLKQYYAGAPFVPHTLVLQAQPQESGLIEQWLCAKRGQRVRIRVPLRGEAEKLVELAAKNAALVLSQDKEKIKREELRTIGAVHQIEELLGLSGIRRMEAFDISNTGGVLSVGSMVVFEDGRPKRSAYRKFRIQTVTGPDDYASMKEVLGRRLRHGLEEQALLGGGGASAAGPVMVPFSGADDATGDITAGPAIGGNAAGIGKFSALPDLLMMDGGKGQVNIALEVMGEIGVEIPVCGMVKDDRHRTRGLYYQNREIDIDTHSEGFQLITRIQDEAHRFAIEYHRSLRGKGQVKSVLDDIPGIGKTRRKALLRAFGSLDAIKGADEDALRAVPGMNVRAAAAVRGYFAGTGKGPSKAAPDVAIRSEWEAAGGTKTVAVTRTGEHPKAVQPDVEAAGGTKTVAVT
ncbi:MAG: excinuclease ABC subunit UvrC [Lachnospiraceae bacterium]|jgi:excinuclease ABC subunit C|nr:excinuclease ABC subunit UvrC [Lachnospiraceae bacterium]